MDTLEAPQTQDWFDIVDQWRFGKRPRVVAGATDDPEKHGANAAKLAADANRNLGRIPALDELPDDAEVMNRIKPYLRHNRVKTELGRDGFAHVVKGLFGKIQTRPETFSEWTSRIHIHRCWIVGPQAVSDDELRRRVRLAEANEAREQAEHTARLHVTTDYPRPAGGAGAVMVVDNSGGNVIE